MTRSIAFHPDAVEELDAAEAWYEQLQSGLGSDFREEIRVALERLSEPPDASTPVPGVILVRRVFIKRFPYAIVFDTEGDTVRVWAVAHTSRRPGYWRRRAKA